MIFKDYYKILGFETSRVSMEEIRNAYREQAKKYHPDLNEDVNTAEERFKDINEAYRILSNPQSKRKYDRSWNSNIGKKRNKENNAKNMNTSNSAFGEIFNMFFGAKKEKKVEKETVKTKKVQAKGDNIETGINVSIEEAYFGANKKISLRAVDGKMKNFTVKIPAGIRNGEKIRLIGQGKTGTNGGKNGDLFIRINIENHKKFKLEGSNIYTYLELAPWEAALGTRVKVQGIDSEETVYIQKGIQSGEKIKIQGKGYKDSKGGRGDLIVEIRIMVPKNLNEEETKIFEKLKEISKFNPRQA